MFDHYYLTQKELKYALNLTLIKARRRSLGCRTPSLFHCYLILVLFHRIGGVSRSTRKDFGGLAWVELKNVVRR